MADSLTANYELVKPEVGASGNTWGGKNNANADAIDTLIKAIDFLSALVKATPILADRIPIIDTETDPDEVKYITLTQLKTLLLTVFSMSDAVFELIDNSDGTKKLQFQLSGITTATIRTLTIPDLSGTVALLTGAQTFADKTIVQPIITLKQGAAEAPTAEGDIRWDTDDNVLVVGDGAATKIFVAIPASMVAGDLLIADGAKSFTQLAKATTYGKVLRTVAAGAPAWGGAAPDVVLEDQKSAGSNGGSISSGSWVKRTLNTEVRDPGGLCSLSSSEFTMTVDGWVEWSAPGYNIDSFQTRLFNVTDDVAVASGSGENSTEGSSGSPRSVGGAPVVAGKAYQIEMRCSQGGGSTGLGNAVNFGGAEVYTRVKFWTS